MRKLSLLVIAVGTVLTAMFAYSASAGSAPLNYVALGDSVAAGAGLPTTTATSDELCGRSDQSYSYVFARHINADVKHYACTGAKIDEGIYGSQTRLNTELFPQLDRAYQQGTPDVITITVGANDARWTEFLTACYTWTCGTTVETYTAKALRADLRAELYYALYKIEQRSGSNPPRVLLSGYYMPLANDTSCVASNRITTDEVVWLQSEFAELNEAIADTAGYFDFATYVPVDFSGHELCTDDSWVQGLRDEAPFHPTAEGQQAIGRAFIDAI